jgi:hypothetical protein
MMILMMILLSIMIGLFQMILLCLISPKLPMTMDILKIMGKTEESHALPKAMMKIRY